MADDEYNGHVSIYSDFPQASRTLWDLLIAILLLLLGAAGGGANVLAFSYFYRSTKRDLATILYIAISVIDIGTCLCQFPVSLSLFSDRSPVWFNNITFCAFWTIVFSFCLEMSIFLVMLLSVSRTTVIAFPFYKINKNHVMVAFVLYPIINLILDLVAYLYGLQYVYGSDGPYCYELPRDYNLNSKAVEMVQKVSNIRSTIQLGIPPVVILTSFVISVVKLSQTQMTFSRSQSRRATVTVAMFTGLFLVCNVPYFALYSLETITVMAYTYPGPFFSNPFMFFYSWTCGKILVTVVNAMLNPVLYYCRMTDFRNWVIGLRFRKTVKQRGPKISIIDSQMWTLRALQNFQQTNNPVPETAPVS